MTIDIVKEMNKVLRFPFVLFILTVFIILYFVFSESKIIFLLVILTNIVSLIISIDFLKYRKIGKLRIFDDMIEVEIDESYKEFKFTEISKLKIDHNYFYRTNFFVKTWNAFNLIIGKSEEEYIYKLYIKGDKVKEQFKNVLEKLYQKGLNVKEYDTNGQRTYLFKANLSYKEIQEIKHKYNLNWLN